MLPRSKQTRKCFKLKSWLQWCTSSLRWLFSYQKLQGKLLHFYSDGSAITFKFQSIVDPVQCSFSYFSSKTKISVALFNDIPRYISKCLGYKVVSELQSKKIQVQVCTQVLCVGDRGEGGRGGGGGSAGWT